MSGEKNLKLHILNRISELDKKIRFIEDLGSLNSLNVKNDIAYTMLVGMRFAYKEMLNAVGEISDIKKNFDR